jgi:hypothetical protein
VRGGNGRSDFVLEKRDRRTSLKVNICQTLVAYAYNPSYLGGRDQEDQGSNTAKQFMRPYLEKLFTKIGLVEWLKVKALSSSSSTTGNK